MIVPVTVQNEEDWAALCCALWPHHTLREMLDALPGQPNEFLYMKDGAVAAFISLSLRHDYVEGTSSSPVGYVEGIYVMPEHRGSGVAKELIHFAKSWAGERGCSELASDCEIENSLSRDFHNAAGFTEAGVNVHFVMILNTV